MILIRKDCASCECTPTVIATYTTNGSIPEMTTWDLSSYLGPGIGTPGAWWRIWERSYDNQYMTGRIAADGTLTGLPSQFDSTYSYEGYMELQQGCCQDYDPCCLDDWNVEWPE